MHHALVNRARVQLPNLAFDNEREREGNGNFGWCSMSNNQVPDFFLALRLEFLVSRIKACVLYANKQEAPHTPLRNVT